ncbi:MULTISPECIES: orotate phosphoribosyltransferase [Mogibacterium]|jgi:orotate phosphoribosyltransferase|uniref:orotate phosphoribosyltransferase n=1 Tax=Mogibacterium TaxID=86331 RepID=UPI00180075B5|nr:MULTISPECIES: orotate phosphoribosyltransferase [Mogibacterium]MBB1533734.1 orotate phosphoribosyltransferase [Mogibacterium sp.]
MTNSASKSKQIAEGLLGIKAVFLSPNDPFTWASGIKSPIYCDNRLTLTAPKVRDVIEHEMARVIDKKFPECDVVMGTSTAGIAHAAISAHILGKPMGYVRGSSKSHGRNNRIEGKLEKGDKVVVVEDLISTGGSSIEVVEALREAGAEVLAVISIFTYETAKADKNFQDANVEKLSLCTISELIDTAVAENYVTSEEGKGIIEWLREI